jgi:DNA-binding transcriptional MerR regulator
MTWTTLLNHPPPYPQETLPSWLWRLSLANYLPSPGLLMRYLRQTVSVTTPSVKQSLINLREQSLFEALGVLTHTSASVVYSHTLHRFAHALLLPDQTDKYIQLAGDENGRLLHHRTNRDFYGIRFSWCPACLAQAPYVRLHWHIPFVTCCTTHHCWLLDACPACQTRLSEPDILARCCKHCGFALHMAHPHPVPEDDLLFQLQTTLMSWLYETSPPEPGFPQVPVNVLLRILQGLRYAAQRAGNDWIFHHLPPHAPRPQLDILKQRQLTIYERGFLYSTAFQGLLDWPQGFYHFLDAYCQRPTRKGKGLKAELGQIYLKWLPRFWAHEAFTFLQDTVNVYLVEHFSATQMVASRRASIYPELVAQANYLNLHRASAVFTISPSVLRHLVNKGHLKARRFDNYPNRLWLARDELETLQSQRQKTMTLTETSELLGVGQQRVHDLLDVGLICKTIDSVFASGLAIDRDSVIRFLEQLQQQIIVAKPYKMSKTVSLVTLCLRLATLGMKLSEVLQLILKGRLKAHHPDTSILPLTDLWFSYETAQQIIDTIKDERDWMGMTEVQAHLGIGRSVIQYLMDNGYLVPHTVMVRKYFFLRTKVMKFQQRSVTVDVASELLNVSTNAVYAFVNNGLLHPIYGPSVNGHGHYAFDRDELLIWDEHYLLERDFRLVTSDIARLRRLLKAHHVTYIMRRPRVYRRAAVLDVMASDAK